MTRSTKEEFREAVLTSLSALAANQKLIYSTLMALDQRLAEILRQGGKVTGPTWRDLGPAGPAYGTPPATGTGTGFVPTYETMRDATQPMLDRQLKATQDAIRSDMTGVSDIMRGTQTRAAQTATTGVPNGKTYIEMITSVRDKEDDGA